jgi:hypothetical protein
VQTLVKDMSDVNTPNFKKEPWIRFFIDMSLKNSFEPLGVLLVIGSDTEFQFCLINKFFVKGLVFFAMFFSFSWNLCHYKLPKFSTHMV